MLFFYFSDQFEFRIRKWSKFSDRIGFRISVIFITIGSDRSSGHHFYQNYRIVSDVIFWNFSIISDRIGCRIAFSPCVRRIGSDRMFSNFGLYPTDPKSAATLLQTTTWNPTLLAWFVKNTSSHYILKINPNSPTCHQIYKTIRMLVHGFLLWPVRYIPKLQYILISSDFEHQKVAHYHPPPTKIKKNIFVLKVRS